MLTKAIKRRLFRMEEILCISDACKISHSMKCCFKSIIIIISGFKVAPTVFQSYGDFPALTGGGRPQMPLRTLFQARAGIWVEPPTFRKLAG